MLTLFVWAHVDFLRFLIERKRPTATEFLWVLCGYSVVWILAALVRDPIAAWVLRLQTKHEEHESRTQGAGMAGREAVQNS